MSSDDSDIETLITPENSFNKGRKNIRKVLKDQHMAQDTQQAAKDEEERLKRITERQKMVIRQKEKSIIEKITEFFFFYSTIPCARASQRKGKKSIVWC